MKKIRTILALFLCVIACGGLVVLFRGEKREVSNNQNDTNVSQKGKVEGVTLDRENIKF